MRKKVLNSLFISRWVESSLLLGNFGELNETLNMQQGDGFYDGFARTKNGSNTNYTYKIVQ